MADLEQSFIFYGKTELEKRKNWYSSVAEAYNRFRPRYSREVPSQVVDIAGLSARSRVLEVGCGPGVATVDFAGFGRAITGSLDLSFISAFHIARKQEAIERFN